VREPYLLQPLAGALSIILLLVLAACGPSAQEIDQRVDQRVQEVLDARPTPTPLVLPPPPTPQPTATPQPTPTPMVLPPTPTPIILPPPPTPQPTATPQPMPAPLTVMDLSNVYRPVWPSVFYIDPPGRGGTGWLLEPGLILTNEHLVRGHSTVIVRQALDPPFTARVVAVDSWRDIALLEIDSGQVRLHPGAQPLPLGQVSNNNIAQPLLALGYSGTQVNRGDGTVGPATANVGVLSQLTNFGSRSFGWNVVMDVSVDPGDSGGPVLNTQGQVVGMTRAAMEQTPGGQRVVGTFFAVHVDEIREALPALRGGQSR
jgi:S1-C subfamily serine protease